MDFIFYFSIGFGTAFSAYRMFAIYFVYWVSHTYLTQASVLKPRKAGIVNTPNI